AVAWPVRAIHPAIADAKSLIPFCPLRSGARRLDRAYHGIPTALHPVSARLRGSRRGGLSLHALDQPGLRGWCGGSGRIRRYLRLHPLDGGRRAAWDASDVSAQAMGEGGAALLAADAGRGGDGTFLAAVDLGCAAGLAATAAVSGLHS